MRLRIKASDLYYKYRRDTASRAAPKFRGKPDPAPFNRDDLYEVVPLLEKVMDELGRGRCGNPAPGGRPHDP